MSVMILDANVSTENRADNVRSAMKRGARILELREPHKRTCILVGGGPSVQNELFTISALVPQGDIFAVNNVPRYLAARGLEPDVHVLMDAMPSVAEFVATDIRCIRYYASQCDPAVLDRAGNELIIWHAASQALDDIPGIANIVGGGSTTATRAIYLAYGLGYRDFHLFGFDSSYDGDKGHAYSQADYETVLDVSCGAETFKSSPQLIAQAEDFKVIIPQMITAGCSVTVHGYGLLRSIADHFIIKTGA